MLNNVVVIRSPNFYFFLFAWRPCDYQIVRCWTLMDDLVVIKSFFFVFFSLGDMVVTRLFNMKDYEDREKKNEIWMPNPILLFLRRFLFF